jgi:hypothetical protein
VPKAAKLTLILAIILGLFLVAADRVLNLAAESAIQKRVSQQLIAQGLQVRGTPQVSIEGFPFLTQAVGGEFGAIRVAIPDLRSDTFSLTGTQIRAVGVKADVAEVLRGGGTVTAARITGASTVAYSSIAGLLRQPNLTSSVDNNGKLTLRMPVQLAGRSVTIVAPVTVALVDGQVRLAVSDIQTEGGELSPGIRARLSTMASALSRELTFPVLPYNLTIERVEVTKDGLRVSASATNVPLSRS